MENVPLLGLVGMVNRLVEAVKRIIAERTTWDEGTRQLVTFLAQLVIGVAAVLIAQSQFDALAGTPFAKMGYWLGSIAAGLTVGLGADALHFILDLTFSKPPETTSANLTVTGTSNISPQATVSMSVGGESEAKG